jgi:RNA polymerase sigma-70 factor, ECF subfamily
MGAYRRPQPVRDLWKSSAYRMSEPMRETYCDTAALQDEESDFPDRRLELMLVCAHPAIAANVRTPLMLQAVLGVEAAAIARAFAVEPTAMAQRLVRAKKRIRDAGIPFVMPDRDNLAERLPAVLEAVYGAYSIDWQVTTSQAPIETLSAEALHLALVLADLLPDEPEVLGLAVLVCLSQSRRPARKTTGEFVTLDAQDIALWDTALIARGEALLRRAHEFGRPGRFQYEAAIQSVHCARLRTGDVDTAALQKLHRAVLRVAPSLGAAVAAAAVDGVVDGPDAGLRSLDAITDPAIERFQPGWTTRAHLLAESGRPGDAAYAFRRAIALTTDRTVADHLSRRLTEVLDAGDS